MDYREYRERQIHQERFWHQKPPNLVDPLEIINQDDALSQLDHRRNEMMSYLDDEQGKLLKALAAKTNDAPKAEMQDLGLL